jgi:hypothetical protein
MKIFVCLLPLNRQPVPEDDRRRFESLARSRRLACTWHVRPGAGVLTASSDPSGCLLAGDARSFVAGIARVDNRAELARWAGVEDQGGADLEFVHRLCSRLGSRCVPRILGDFGFVAWNADTRTAIAACDALAVRKVYYLERGGLLAFASHAEALASGDRYERRFLAEQVASAESSPELTVYHGVKAVPAGTVMQLTGHASRPAGTGHPKTAPPPGRWRSPRRRPSGRCGDCWSRRSGPASRGRNLPGPSSPAGSIHPRL